MTITNPSFENEGVEKGTAQDWDTADLSSLVEVAEFGDLCGYQRFEKGWNLPLGLNRFAGLSAGPFAWASITNGVETIGIAPPSEFVARPHAAIVAGLVPAGGVVVTMDYVSDDGLVPGRIATAAIPAGAKVNQTFDFNLEDTDKGFSSISSVTTVPDLPSVTIEVHGSWLRSPSNEEAKFVFEDADLFAALFPPAAFPTKEFEDFEAGWGNDVGALKDFDALKSEQALFDSDTDSDEDFENAWNLPAAVATIKNESQIFAHAIFLDGSISTRGPKVYGIIENVNDQISMRWLSGGTANDLVVAIPPGLYGVDTVTIKSVAGSQLVDGEEFQLVDSPTAVFFEFDDDGSVVDTPSRRAVPFSATDDASQIRGAIIAAIQGSALDVDLITDTGAVLYVQGKNLISPVRIEAVSVADPDFVTTRAITLEIAQGIQAALDADLGLATGGSFDCNPAADGRIRLVTSFSPGGGRAPFRVLDPPSGSAWGTLGFTPSLKTQRSAFQDNVDVAEFSSTSNPFENFEFEWRSNETSIFTLPDDANGVIDAADFGGGGPNTPETFESGWTLTLP